MRSGRHSPPRHPVWSALASPPRGEVGLLAKRARRVGRPELSEVHAHPPTAGSPHIRRRSSGPDSARLAPTVSLGSLRCTRLAGGLKGSTQHLMKSRQGCLHGGGVRETRQGRTAPEPPYASPAARATV